MLQVVEPRPKRCRNEWPHEHDFALRDLAGQGWSGGMIAVALGRTRNAIIGRAHRLGVELRGVSRAPYNSLPKVPVSIGRPRPMPAAFRPVAPVSVAPEPLLKPLWELEDSDCRYAVNEGGPYLFCGHPRHGNSSYCQAHALITTRPTPKEAA